jgi:predicted Rossmann-fold nucleotide-binding protein
VAAETFARKMRDVGYMIITGGGDGIMGAAQRGAGREHSFGLISGSRSNSAPTK